MIFIIKLLQKETISEYISKWERSDRFGRVSQKKPRNFFSENQCEICLYHQLLLIVKYLGENIYYTKWKSLLKGQQNCKRLKREAGEKEKGDKMNGKRKKSLQSDFTWFVRMPEIKPWNNCLEMEEVSQPPEKFIHTLKKRFSGWNLGVKGIKTIQKIRTGKGDH